MTLYVLGRIMTTKSQGNKGEMNPRMLASAAPKAIGLYDPRNEHDACGLGFIAHIKNKKSHDIIRDGLTILENLEHRGAVGADPKAGDGCGILIQIPDAFLRNEISGFTLPEAGTYGVAMTFFHPMPHSAKHLSA